MEQINTTQEETIQQTDIIIIIKRLMKENKVTQTAMAQELGISKQSLHQRLASNADLKFEQVVNMLDVMGYQIHIRRKPSENSQNLENADQAAV